MRTAIVVTLQFEGFHNWADARNLLPIVGFLADRHRHVFHVKAEKLVQHDDRDVEIIMFKTRLLKYLKETYPSNTYPFLNGIELGSKSCEMIAAELLNEFDLTRCEVLEDGENGAVVYG